MLQVIFTTTDSFYSQEYSFWVFFAPHSPSLWGKYPITLQYLIPKLRGALGFSVSANFEVGFSVFAPQYFGFSGLLQFAVFPFLSIWLNFGFRPKYKWFLWSGIHCGFWFFLFGFQFLFGNYAPQLRALYMYNIAKFPQSPLLQLKEGFLSNFLINRG